MHVKNVCLKYWNVFGYFKNTFQDKRGHNSTYCIKMNNIVTGFTFVLKFQKKILK